MISRREFLLRFTSTAGCLVVTASAGQLLGCSTVAQLSSTRYKFPQGIASADPQPDAVVLWTRVADQKSNKEVKLTVQVSASADFETVVVNQRVVSEPAMDHTLRVFVQGLQPNSWYWYRFVAPDGSIGPLGRTHTAPAHDASVPLRLAMFSCQSYEQGFFNAYQQLITDDAKLSLAEQVKMCVHVGDWYYEVAGEGDRGRQPLQNADGVARSFLPLPSGGAPGPRPGKYVPATLEDYRHYHRNTLADDALLRARALYPFVYIWDDHEVVNDYWQSYSNAGPVQKLKLASNQAWVEYMPAALSRAAAGPAGYNPARDFQLTEVDDAPAGEFDENYLSLEENNLKAINSVSIYRSLKWGKLADLLLVDGRSYRGARGVDSKILGTDSVSYPANPIDPKLVEILNAGRTYNGGNPPAEINYEGKVIPNPRKDAPRGSMLGATQKQWLKESLVASDASWRVILNNVPMMRFGFDTRNLEHGVRDGLYFTDGWDGYPVERRELVEFIRDNKIANVVSLTGDRHAQYAGMVMDDYDADAPQAVFPELVGTSVSALSRFQLQKILAKGDAFFESMAGVKAPPAQYLYPEYPTINGWMLFGAEAAEVFNETLDESKAKQSADPRVNPHLAYADNDAYGYFSVTITADKMVSEFVSQPQPLTDYTNARQQPVRRRVYYTVPAWKAGQTPRLELTEIKGEQPILGIK